MRAIDTNVVVRFLTGDDAAQAAKARKLIREGEILVSASVLLETEWVLRSAYGYSVDRIVQALRGFCGLPGVRIDDDRTVDRALGWAEQGLDFADALHLARAEGCTAFLSFDRRLARKAARLSDVEVVVP
ncbi:type II toxin-antitoxin system VapC family toxin [Sphingosinicella terrae]|uniref:type II toxin-antitoxin system VapC family toxin n=1 Tax=Sphingosinicella terrae TaxID=2172047 RepID=UPI000E0DF53F|nr:type II toxin-antitoxin system VapC family toxin [Sphingosinicella terrae]